MLYICTQQTDIINLNTNKMNYYGKNQSELTELENELLHVDRLLANSMLMNIRGESLIGGNPYFDMTSGTHEDIEEKFYIRTEMICKILDIKNPEEKTIFQIVSETPYDIQKFCVDHITSMYGKPYDLYYHYCMKVHEEKKEQEELETV